MRKFTDNSIKLRQLSWYSFDMGNSAHALLVSTVGFSLYFKTYLYQGDPNADSIWAAITALILLISAVVSPILTSALYGSSKRYLGVATATVFSVLATLALGTQLSEHVPLAIIIYILSAIGYYVALPLYNCYLPHIANSRLQRISAIGWALGYLGGIAAAVICLLLGYLDHDPAAQPELYRRIFIVAAAFNLILSLPFLISARKIDRNTLAEKPHQWCFREVFAIFGKYKNFDILKVFMVYWLVGEAAVIVTYFLAIFLKEYAGLETKQIMTLAIAGQVLAIITTWAAGLLSERFGDKRILYASISIWIFVPITLFTITLGITYWLPIILSSLVIGSYHSIIRGRIAYISCQFDHDAEKGSLFGFLEVTGRISQVVGPLMMLILTLFLPLHSAFLFVAIFPLLSILVLTKTRWSSGTK